MMVSTSRRIGRSTHRSVGPRAGRGLAALLAVGALALGGVLMAPGAAGVVASPSSDATTDAASVRWAVKPANAEGVDGRPRIETSADPGATVQEHLAVKNLGDTEVTFALSSADGFFNKNGRFDMLTTEKESVDAGTWIVLPETVTVAARKTAVVPFTITVPKDAAVGAHEAGVAASILSDSGSMQVVSRVGFRVAITVSGEVTPGLDLKVTEATYHASWNPFSAGTLEIHFSLANDGNVSLAGSGIAMASGLFGGVSAQKSFQIKDVAPGQSLQGSVVVEGVWPAGQGTAELVLTPSPLEGSDQASQPPLERDVGFWALPWPQLALVLLLALVVVGVRFATKWRKRRLEARLDRLVEARLSSIGAGASAVSARTETEPVPTPGATPEPRPTRRSVRSATDRRSGKPSERDEGAARDSEQDSVGA